MPDLRELVKHRRDILLAEVAAWLHDVGKLHSGHQSKYLRDEKRAPYTHTRFGPGRSSKFLEDFSRTANININFQGSQVTLKEIIRDHHKRYNGNCLSSNDLVCLVQRTDWIDSEYDRNGIIGRGKLSFLVQPLSSGFGVFSVFGYSRRLYQLTGVEKEARNKQVDCSKTDVLTKFLCRLKEFLDKNPPQSSVNSHANRDEIKEVIKGTHLTAAGDTRYSVNDITLWEHTHSVSVLLKVFLAWLSLHNSQWSTRYKGTQLRDLVKNHSTFTRWFRPQLLPLRIDGLGFLAASNNIPDLLARRELLREVYDTWRDILEWEFPLAGEVYRDENGPVFLTFLRNEKGQGAIPLNSLNLPKNANHSEHVLDKVYQQATTLEDYLRKAIVELTQGDLTLPPNLPLYTYTQRRTGRPDEKSLGDLLADEQKQGLWFQSDASKLSESWNKLKEIIDGIQGTSPHAVPKKSREEICQICGLRPQGYGRWLVLQTEAQEERRTEKVKEAKQEWHRHYEHHHDPKKPYSKKKTEEERKCQVCKAISRGICGVCLERRVKRAEKWAQGIHKSSRERLQESHPETVWLDEVADKNGRLALIVGYFPLEHWLDGTLIESLGMFKQDSAESPPTNRRVTVKDDQGNAVEVVLGPKPISYSRIRRVWETTRRFWQDVAPTDAPPEELVTFCRNHNLNLEDLWEGPLSLEKSLAGQASGEKRPRLFLKGTLAEGNLGSFNTYEMMVEGRKVAVLWVPAEGKKVEDIPEKYRGGFWVIENLAYLESENAFGRPVEDVFQPNRTYEIYEPSEYGKPGEATAQFTLKEPSQKTEEKYTPLIPILAEPRTFMALLPADKAVDVVRDIKAKYEREMGKVRNRLPLHLGIVFADAHQPLRTILDAGRRMLRQQVNVAGWKVTDVRKQPDDGGTLPERFKDDASGQFAKWYEVALEKDLRKVTWYVPARMGDGQTKDNWYPYVFWDQDKDGNTSLAHATEPRTCYYQAPNPFNLNRDGNPQPGWLVHAGELQPGDVIYFTPATLDFIFLDHGGRRFEIAYRPDGRRRGTLHRPYLLDELDDLVQCWKLLAGDPEAGDREKKVRRLSTTQLHAVRDLIENKRTEWFEKPEDSLTNETFRRFCESVLQNAEWQTKPTESELTLLTHWAVTSLLADAVDLFYHIMKQRPVGEEKNEV